MYNLFTPTKAVFAAYVFSFGVLIKELQNHPNKIKDDLVEECYSPINRDVAKDVYGLMKYRSQTDKSFWGQARLATEQIATLTATLFIVER